MRSALAGIATLTLADRIQTDDARDEQHDSAKQDKEADHLRFFFPRNSSLASSIPSLSHERTACLLPLRHDSTVAASTLARNAIGHCLSQGVFCNRSTHSQSGRTLHGHRRHFTTIYPDASCIADE